jgi:hypothetical protein
VRTEVEPILERYCLSCHAKGREAAFLDFSVKGTIARGRVEFVAQLDRRQMPPKLAAQPTAEESASLRRWAACGARGD